MIETCKTCKFYHLRMSKAPGAQRGTCYDRSECHRYPPSDIWPSVTPDDTCGEYRRRVTTRTKAQKKAAK